MAPKPKADFVYIYFRHEPNKRDRDLKYKSTQHNTKIGEFLVSQRDWPFEIIAAEVNKLAVGTNVCFTEWFIEVQDFKLFNIDGVRYEKILVILGEELVYWTFYMDTPRGRHYSNKAAFNLTFCPCCIHEQYKRLMEIIKGYIDEQFVPIDV